MKFFRFLAIAFPVYVGIAYLASYILNLTSYSEIRLPNLLDQFLQILGFSLIIPSLPFTSILKSLGMYVTAYWSLPTTGGIILSTLIWEVIFVSLFFGIRKYKDFRRIIEN